MTKLTTGNNQNAITTDLNALANAAAVAGTTVIDNTVNLDPWGAYNAHFVFAVAPTAGTTMDLYKIPEWDGTNYDTVDAANLPQTALFICSFTVTGVGTTQNLTQEGVSLTPNKWKVALKNNSGQALAGTLSTIKLYSYQTQ